MIVISSKVVYPPGVLDPMRPAARHPITGCNPAVVPLGCLRAFTLIELLVVIAINSILAAMLLPVLVRVKEQAHITQCLNNLHQISIAFRLYINDNTSRYPPASGDHWQSYRFGGGDPGPQAQSFHLELAINRPLWPYTHSRELYRCPADRGSDMSPWMPPFNSTYEAVGTSYKYNETPWCPMLVPDKDHQSGGLAGKREDWIRYPARFVLVHEGPATPYPPGVASSWRWVWSFWHYARGPGTVTSYSPYNYLQLRDHSISPVLFADGHASSYDFTHAIRSSPSYPAEPQPDWYWYEPAK